LFERPDHLRFAVLALRHTLFPFPSSEIILTFVRKEGIRSRTDAKTSTCDMKTRQGPVHRQFRVYD